jgi:hypothetical protein
MISHGSFKKCKWQENIPTVNRDIRNSHNVKTINFMSKNSITEDAVIQSRF